MQKIRVPVSSFQYGEVSDSLIMRTDTAVYTASAQRLENMVVMAEGSVKKRYGMKHIYDYSITYSSSNPEQSHLYPFVFDENEEYIISIEHQKVRCFRLIDGSDTVSLVATITADTSSAALPFDQAYLKEYTTAQYGDVMFISHPLFAPRMLTRTSLTSFEISTYSFDQRSDGLQIYQPYSKFQSHGVTLDPSDTSNNIDDDDVCQSQSVSSGANLVLNGSRVSGGEVVLSHARRVRIESTALEPIVPPSTYKFFRIVGEDDAGNAINESLNLNTTTVAESSKRFRKITAVQLNPQIGTVGNVKVGIIDSRTFTTSSSYFDTGSVLTASVADGSLVVDNWYIVEATGNSDFTTVGAHEHAVGSVFRATGVGDNTKTGNVSHISEPLHHGVTIRYGGNEVEILEVQSATQATGDIVDELKIRLSVLNPLRTIDGSSTVEVTHIAHGFGGGESITLSEASATGGINTGNLNGARTVGTVIDENTYTITAGGNASSAEDGGGYVKVTTHSPTSDWDEQSWSAKRGYPAAVEFHENRLCFGGTIAEPDNIWMSQLGEFFNFDVGDAADTDSISMVAATGDVNEIRYLVSNRDLQVFTASNELYVPTYLNQAITPTNAQIRKQTPYGVEHVEPMSIDGATIFVQNNGKMIREYIYTDTEEAYTATSVSTIASHLINAPTYLAVVHSGFGLPDSYAALTLNDGDMTLFSSNRAEKRASWSRVTTNGRFGSVCAIEDRLFVNAYDSENKLQLCEFRGDIGLDFYLYGAIGSNVVDVSALYNHNDVVDVIATDGTTLSSLGQFTVNSSNQVDMSAHSGSGYTHIYAGKKFTAKLVTNPIDVSAGNGPTTGDIRGITNVVVDMKNTRSAKINNRLLVTTSGFTGKKEFRLLGYDRNPQVTIEQDHPLDMQINGLVAELII